MSETILVTGSSGFIGRRLVRQLLEERYSVRLFLRPESPGMRDMPGVQTVRGSFADQQALARAVAGVDRIIHLAGVTRAAGEAGYDAGNFLPVSNLLEQVARRDSPLQRFVYISSLVAAGPASEGVDGVAEDDSPAPVSAYGRSKLKAERCCLQYANDIDITIIRPPVVYGPGDRDVLQVFQMLSRGFLVSPGPLSRRRFSMIYVDDLVDGILSAARLPQASGRLYYLTAAPPVSWDAIIRVAAPLLGRRSILQLSLPFPLVALAGMVVGGFGALTGRPVLLNRDKVNELVQSYWVCSSLRSGAELGFVAPTTLPDGIAKTISWYRDEGWL